MEKIRKTSGRILKLDKMIDRSTDQPTEQVTVSARDSFTHLKTGIPRNTKKIPKPDKSMDRICPVQTTSPNCESFQIRFEIHIGSESDWLCPRLRNNPRHTAVLNILVAALLMGRLSERYFRQSGWMITRYIARLENICHSFCMHLYFVLWRAAEWLGDILQDKKMLAMKDWDCRN